MSNIINFTSLKRKEIRKEFKNGIQIYNPNPEQKQQIMKMIIDNMNDKNEISLSGKDILLTLIPMLTNIHLDTSDDELVIEILDDPSDELSEVCLEIKNIIDSITKVMLSNINGLMNLTPTERNKFLEELSKQKEEVEIELTAEEIEKFKKFEAQNKKLQGIK